MNAQHNITEIIDKKGDSKSGYLKTENVPRIEC